MTKKLICRIKININMRCIEIYLLQKFEQKEFAININMRCIEIGTIT